MNARQWKDRLDLQPHPEGGFFRETYRSAEGIPVDSLPSRFPGDRVFSTAIYYLLETGQFSAFHRIRSDEMWHFYDGDPLEIVLLGGTTGTNSIRMGRDDGCELQAVVPAGIWFAARCVPGSSFSLCGCTVAPGFDFADFEMADRDDLCRAFPADRELILTLTR